MSGAPPLRQELGRRLDDFAAGLAGLGREADMQVLRAIDAWDRGDAALAHRVLIGDAAVDRRASVLAREAFDLQLLHAPCARDLRLLHAGLVVAVALERVGDLAVAVAGLVPRVAHDPVAAEVAMPLRALGAAALRALDGAVEGLVTWDPDTARGACAEAPAATRLLDEVSRAASAGPRPEAERRWTSAALLVARHLERVVDNACEIAARVRFVATGAAVGRWG